MRTTVVFLMLFSALASNARAQSPLDVGTPEAAFAGGPIHLSRNAIALLRAHYQGDKVPVVPQPYRGKLDTALLGLDWPRVEAVKKELVAAQGFVPALAWEQSRFVATGAIGLAEIHALDVAATGSTGLSETAVMMWLYAAAVTMTDGHKCNDETVKDAHLDRLRGPAFEPVIKIVRTISDDRLAAMRDLAIRLENVLAPVRTDDTMCRGPGGRTDVKPESLWRPDAAVTRAMLPKHLVALAAVMRPRPIARPEPPRQEAAKPAAALPQPAKIKPPDAVLFDPFRVQPAIPRPEIAEPVVPELPKPDKAAAAPEPTPVEPKPATAEPPDSVKPATSSPESAPKVVADPERNKPNPAKFEPPKLELAAPDQPRQ